MKYSIPAEEIFVRRSLPAWGAWIEIILVIVEENEYNVAPRMGGVD